MSQITPAGAQRWIISDEATAWSATAGALATNTVYLFAFEINVPVAVSGMRIHTGTATGTVDLGIYDVNGNLLVHTGAVATVANTTSTNNFSSNYTLGVGRYFLALCPSNNTDTYQKVSGVANMAPMTRWRLSATNGTAGVLPATTGGTAATSIAPLMAALVVGGLS